MSKIIFTLIVTACIIYICSKAFDKTFKTIQQQNAQQIEMLNSIK